MPSRELLDQRAQIVESIRALSDATRGRVRSGEEETAWERLTTDYDVVQRNLGIETEAETILAAMDSPAETVNTRGTEMRTHPLTPEGPAGTAATQSAVRSYTPGAGDFAHLHDYERAFDAFLRRGLGNMPTEQRQLMEREYRDLSVGTNTAGGFTVPPGFVQRITDAMKAYGGMLEVANVINTESGQPLVWPTADDTGNVGAILAENNPAPIQDVTFGQKNLSAFMYTSKMVKVSYQLLNDSAFDLNAWLPQKFAQRIGRAINAHFTAGTGGGLQPAGLIPNLAVGKAGPTGQTITVTLDDLIDLIHSIDPEYRANARFMLADSTIRAVRKIKDSTGQPVWQPGMQAGVPDTLLGYPLTINQDMPVMAASAKSIAFGDFRAAYVVRQVQGVQVKRFDERYADALQVGFLSFARYDGTVDDAQAARVYQNSAT